MEAFVFWYYVLIYFILIFSVTRGLSILSMKEEFKSSTESENLITKEYPFNWDYDDKTIDIFIQDLKGKEYTLRQNQKLSDSLSSIITGKFNILDIKNIVQKDDKILVPLFIGKFQENIVRRVILVLSMTNDKVTIENIIVPKDVDPSSVEILPSFNTSTLIKTTDIDYKEITRESLLKDDLILTDEIKPIPEDKNKPEEMCYGIPEFQKIGDREQCNFFGGVWDKPVIKDEECPFYKKNINYPNKRGGAKYGRCELPLGMKLLGFRYFNLDEIYAPLCYGCDSKRKIDTCCMKQQNPDYAFTSDSSDRKLYGFGSYSDVD